jgi:hypothetical protein
MTVSITDEPFTYRQDVSASFFHDVLIGGPGASRRLERHATEMRAVRAVRELEARRSIASAGFEYRVEPNRTPGQGGNFAPPAWLNQYFATANRPRRVLAGLMRSVPLPQGASSVNTPVIASGSAVQPTPDGSVVPDQDITDSASSSAAVPITGNADIALQLLEQSPPSAGSDIAIFTDLLEAYDAQLETQLLVGTGGTGIDAQLLGVTNVTGINTVTYTSGSPTGLALDPLLGQVAAKIGDTRSAPPQCWLMRTARWTWFQTSEDNSNRPFGLATGFYLGNDDDTPDPIGGFLGWPVFLADAIPTTLSGNPGSFAVGTGTQDAVVCIRPTDSILFESDIVTSIFREPLSGSAGVRLQMHGYAGALTARRPAGIGVVGGSGLARASGF